MCINPSRGIRLLAAEKTQWSSVTAAGCYFPAHPCIYPVHIAQSLRECILVNGKKEAVIHIHSVYNYHFHFI